MKLHALLRAGALCAAVLITAGCSAAAVFAEEESSEAGREKVTAVSGDYTYSVLVDADDETHRGARIESYSGSETEIEIPAELDDLSVVSLGDYAFAGAADVTKFTLPESVTEIGKYTFAACTSLLEYPH